MAWYDSYNLDTISWRPIGKEVLRDLWNFTSWYELLLFAPLFFSSLIFLISLLTDVNNVHLFDGRVTCVCVVGLWLLGTLDYLNETWRSGTLLGLSLCDSIIIKRNGWWVGGGEGWEDRERKGYSAALAISPQRGRERVERVVLILGIWMERTR